jgi:TonB family protein
MLEHEKQHIYQGHTFDVLVLEFVAVFQWFNPFFWMFRRALRENHEFLADQAVISHGTAPSRYKQILLNQYVGEQIVLANNFNYSLIKTRIRMISKIKSRKIANVKFLVGIVLAVSLIAVFACEQKKSLKTEVASIGKSVTLVADGHALQINGDSAAIEKLKIILSESPNCELRTDPSNGQLIVKVNPKIVDGFNTTITSIGSIKTYDGSEEVYTIVEEMPDFPGGQTALRNFIAKAVKYPTEASSKGIQGKVFVNFVVSKDGSVKNARIVRGVDPLLDMEALRVVNTLPAFKPGKQKGNIVAVQYTIPINFALQ